MALAATPPSTAKALHGSSTLKHCRGLQQHPWHCQHSQGAHSSTISTLKGHPQPAPPRNTLSTTSTLSSSSSSSAQPPPLWVGLGGLHLRGSVVVLLHSRGASLDQRLQVWQQQCAATATGKSSNWQQQLAAAAIGSSSNWQQQLATAINSNSTWPTHSMHVQHDCIPGCCLAGSYRGRPGGSWAELRPSSGA